MPKDGKKKSDGGMSTFQKLLGSGGAQKAAKAMQGRKRKLSDALKKAGG